jgi:hypothetical protein
MLRLLTKMSTSSQEFLMFWDTRNRTRNDTADGFDRHEKQKKINKTPNKIFISFPIQRTIIFVFKSSYAGIYSYRGRAFWRQRANYTEKSRVYISYRSPVTKAYLKTKIVDDRILCFPFSTKEISNVFEWAAKRRVKFPYTQEGGTRFVTLFC